MDDDTDTSLDDFDEWDGPPYRQLDRDRGFLTADDRRYLAGERELEGQHERNTRFRIRGRTKQALLDLGVLVDYLHAGDWAQIAADEDIDNRLVRSTALAALYHLYIHGDADEPLLDWFADELESAILQHHPWSDQEHLGRSVTVDIEIAEQGPSLKEIEQAVISGKEVGLQEAAFYTRFGDNDWVVDRLEDKLKEFDDVPGT